MKFYKIGAYWEFVCLEACLQNYLQWIFGRITIGRKLKIKVRPAGLEPATPCLEGRFGQISETDDFLSNIELLDSVSYH